MTRNIDRTAALNRLLNLERFSLANYLQYARPLVRPGDEALHGAVQQIARDQLGFAQRTVQLIERRKAAVEPGLGFPAAYTICNDLEIRHLLDRLMEDEERIIREVVVCRADLRGDEEAERLVAEVLSSEQAHWKKLLGFHGARSIPAAGLTCAA